MMTIDIEVNTSASPLHRRAYTYHGLAEGEQRLEQRVERRHRIFLAVFSL